MSDYLDYYYIITDSFIEFIWIYCFCGIIAFITPKNLNKNNVLLLILIFIQNMDEFNGCAY